MNFSLTRVNLRAMVESSVNLFIVLVEVLLLARVFFKFFFTVASGSFFHWIYATTDSALAPFRGLFPQTANGGTPPTHWFVDWVALFAMAAYAVVFLAAVGFASWLGWVGRTRK
ncbi:MAG TPA: hypothetical protein VFP35_04425 [Candidatus Saccharimonadales bacterium]|nr:hypothetical protein [Candidatus Saccharimonadales bacterium]